MCVFTVETLPAVTLRGRRYDPLMRRLTTRSRPDLAIAVVTGAVAGLAGTLAMATFEAAWSRMMLETSDDPHTVRENRTRLANAGIGAGHAPQGEPRTHHRETSASEAAAEALWRATTGRSPSSLTRERAGSLFHFAFGAAAGAIYRALAATKAKSTVEAGRGTLYGAAVWLLADEFAMPLTGFADPPYRTPLRRHGYVLMAHLAYGLGLHAATRTLGRI